MRPSVVSASKSGAVSLILKLIGPSCADRGFAAAPYIVTAARRSKALGHQPPDPFRQRKGPGVDVRIVVIGLEPSRCEPRPCPLDSRGRAQPLALARPAERHEAADIGRHYRQIEARLGEKSG